MRRILVVCSLIYMSVSVVVGIHAVIMQDRKQDDDIISHEILDRAILWPLRLFE